VPTDPSLFAISEGRRVAHDAGVTVFAVVLSSALPAADVQRIAGSLGVAGADKVLFCEAPGLDAPPLDATHGLALLTAIERVPPLLVLFPAGGAGPQLGPPLAVRLGAAFAAAADIEVADSPAPMTDSVGRVLLRRWRRDRSGYRRLDPVEMERPVIAILGAHGAPRIVGTEDVEVEVIECPAQTPARVVELDSAPDEDAALSLAHTLVLVDGSAGPEVAAQLAAAAPAGVAVADRTRRSAAAIAASSPGLMVCVGTSEMPASPSPSTRVAVVLAPGAEEPPRGSADVVWHSDSAGRWDELAAALPRLRRGDGGGR
jgi:Electron transfer flavoprotein domain